MRAWCSVGARSMLARALIARSKRARRVRARHPAPSRQGVRRAVGRAVRTSPSVVYTRQVPSMQAEASRLARVGWKATLEAREHHSWNGQVGVLCVAWHH